MRSTKRTRPMLFGLSRAAVIGLAGGVASLGFRELTHAVQNLVGIGSSVLQGARTLEMWQLLALPTGGAIVSAICIYFLVRGTKGVEVTDVMEAVSVKRGHISLRSALSRALASMFVIATGGSVGREGPIIAISSSGASALARLLRAPMAERGVLLGCGVAAGFAAAYNAPIAGAIFAMEVVLGNFAMEVFAPVVVSSVTAMLFTHYVSGGAGIYVFPHEPFQLLSALECIPYLVLGAVAGVAAVTFQYMLSNSGKWFAKLVPGPRIVRMAVGGVAIGALAMSFPEVWGNGYDSVNEFLNASGPGGPRLSLLRGMPLVGSLLLLLLVKMVGTTVTVGSGASGGVFTPTLFVGATLGSAFGEAIAQFAPHAVGPSWGYAVVGMGCLVAGTTRAPVMAIVVIFEMTRDYEIVLPLMLGCIAASIVAKRIFPYSIYEEKLAERGALPPVGLEENVLVMTQVGDVMRTEPDSVGPSITYAEIVQRMTVHRAMVLFVCGPEKRLLGVIRLHDLIELASLGDLGPTIIAADLMVPVEPITADRPLAEVFELYEHSALGEVPVVADAQSGRLVGSITRRDVMSAMHMEVLKKRNLRAKFVHPDDESRRADYVELPAGAELARLPMLPRLAGRTLAEAAVRADFGLTVVNVIRPDPERGERRIVPGGSFVLQADDELIVIGDEQAVARWRAEPAPPS